MANRTYSAVQVADFITASDDDLDLADSDLKKNLKAMMGAVEEVDYINEGGSYELVPSELLNDDSYKIYDWKHWS